MEGMPAPILRPPALICPHCGAYAQQDWISFSQKVGDGPAGTAYRAHAGTCQVCKKYSVWVRDKMVFPRSSLAPRALGDMPDDVKADFNEAREVLEVSPRAAAALLRLALQKLMPHLGEKGENINADIGSLVKKGLQVEVQQALDSVRVVGNEAVHPGVLDLKDDQVTAVRLFGLVNFIVHRMITQPKQIAAIYSSLPQDKLTGIENRDKKTS